MRLIRLVSIPFAMLCFLSAGAFAQAELSSAEHRVITRFERRARDYHQMRERIETGLTKLPAEATPEQIDIHKLAFQKAVQKARKKSRQGELFNLSAARLIRRLIKSEFTDFEKSELRASVLEAENKGVPLKVNAVYPASQELVEMPPQLLLALPELPRSLRFRFVGRSLVLVDRENSLILDFMRNALP